MGLEPRLERASAYRDRLGGGWRRAGSRRSRWVAEPRWVDSSEVFIDFADFRIMDRSAMEAIDELADRTL